MQHNGYMMRQWVFGRIHHVKMTLGGAEHRGCCIRVALCDFQSHRQEMGTGGKTMTSICDKLEKFRQWNSCVWHHLQRVTIPMSAPNMVYPDNRIRHNSTHRQSSPKKTTCVTTVLIATIESNHARIHDINNFTQNQDRR